MAILDRISILLQERQEDLPFLIEGTEACEDGSMRDMLAGELRFIAVCKLRLEGDSTAFRSGIEKGLSVTEALFDEFDAGRPVDDSFVTYTQFHWVLDAFAAGLIDDGIRFARKLGRRPSAERKNDSMFVTEMGRAICEMVDNKPPQNSLRKQLVGSAFEGYWSVLCAIHTGDAIAVSQGMDEVLKRHEELCRAGEEFADTPDELVCMWGLGLMNYARHKGIKVEVGQSGYMPKEAFIAMS